MSLKTDRKLAHGTELKLDEEQETDEDD